MQAHASRRVASRESCNPIYLFERESGMETSGEIFRRERRLVAEDSEASRNDRPRNASCKCSARCARQRVAHVRAYLTHRRGVAAAAAPRRGEASPRKMENRGDVNPGLLHGQGCIIITRIRRVSRNPRGSTATIVLDGISRTRHAALCGSRFYRGKFVAPIVRVFRLAG